ncbi:MAG: DUF6152 family protein [Steroidobacteraceae bacterium]
MANIGAAWAHHSYAMWNHNKVLTASGTIGAIQWMNPHVWVWVYVPKKHGEGYDLYGFESNTVPNISRLGWHKDSLKVRGGLTNSDTVISGRTAVHSHRGRSSTDAKTKTQPFAGVQGSSGAGSHKGREDRRRDRQAV